MSDLRSLYQEVILDHSRSPRNFGGLEGASHEADGHNPLCGDQVTIHLKVVGETVEDVRFEGAGCAISMASASMMTQHLKGRPIAEVQELFAEFHALVKGESQESGKLGKLAVFAGVSEYPIRVKCATLAWHTLLAALRQESTPVSTE